MSTNAKSETQNAIWINARLATLDPDINGDFSELSELHALITKNGKISEIIPMSQFSKRDSVSITHDLNGAWITPGLIDCHTHIVYGGDRSNEWAKRLQGISYQEISKQGGGILSTVKATKQLTDQELAIKASIVLRTLMAEGVTCLEIKSGYGLDLETEIKILKAIHLLKEICDIDLSPTLLAAHAIPPEYAGRSDEYITLVCNEIIPEVAKNKLAEAVDVFCESIAFSVEQCERVFLTAKSYGLKIKGHMDQLSNLGGSSMAAKHGALSVDHLEYLSEKDILDLKNSRTVAVLLPGAFYTLREKQKPPVEALRKHGIPMAVATDCNPGSSPIASIRMAMNFACVLYGLSPAEALIGVTRNAAKALDRHTEIGIIKTGYDATFCVWDVSNPVAIVSDLTHNPLRQVVVKGKIR